MLDVGCAVGLAISLMTEMQMVPVGVDISSRMAALARQRNPHQDIMVGDFLSIDFAHHFDGVYAQSFIHLYPKDLAIRAIERMWHLLEDHGVLFISTTIENQSSEGWLAKSDYIGHPMRFRKSWQREELVGALSHCGFSILRGWDLVDPFGKNWMIYIARKSVDSAGQS